MEGLLKRLVSYLLPTFSLLLITVLPTATSQELKRISAEELRDKIYASWIAQCVGNIYGLPHENAYINEPVATNAIRIIGATGGVDHWTHQYPGNVYVTHFSSISELSAHSTLPDYTALSE
jgi:hypothetical protein